MVDWFQTLVLALIQGLSEFLPISSSAHLVLPSQVFGWPDQGLMFDVAVHAGTLIAVVIYYWRDLLAVAGDIIPALRSDKWHPNELWYLGIATVPAVIAGFLFSDLIETNFRGMGVIATTTLLFGGLLGFAAWRNNHHEEGVIQRVSLKGAVVIGVAQVLALIPGTSRSGITITAGLLLGYNAQTSARFSFLLSVPVIAGAMLFMVLDAVELGTGAVSLSHILVAMAVSCISAYSTIALFIKLLGKIGMMPFVVYRLFLGVALLALMVS